MGNKETENRIVVQESTEETERDSKQEAIALLDDREREALAYLERSRRAGLGYAPVAETTSDRFFKLFLRGLTCEDIRQLNPGFQLSQIVECRVNGRWDERRQAYDLQLVTDGREAMARAQMEAALLAADMLSVASMMQRERLHKYVISRNEKDLEGMDYLSLKTIARNLELLLVATRQESLPGRLATPQKQASDVQAPEMPEATPRSLVELASMRRTEQQARFAVARKKR